MEEELDELSTYWERPEAELDEEKDDNGQESVESEGSDHSQTDNSNGNGESVAKSIKAIDKSVVHQICSAQVIVTLSTGVKELVENALDAGATSVEIKLVEYGSEAIHVIDNGSGVTEDDFQGLALKHHTSKISDFHHLSTISTFGFRGEALSSLAALSELTVITRGKNAKTGFKLEYDSFGKLISQEPYPREQGTIIILKNLFKPLPVRHREFLKNLKKEFHKMINVLYGYCLISSGVRLMCNHQQGIAPFTSIFSIPASESMNERIVSLFGVKQLQSLIQFQQDDLIGEETLTEFGLSRKTFVNDRFRIEGYVSKPNMGRSSNDRQFFFINSRPCDLPKVSKSVNEVFHTFSRNQSAFVCLDIRTSQENVDVNVTPDKRLLYLQSEKSLYAILRASLVSLYTTECSTFQTSNIQESFESSQQSQRSFNSSSRSTNLGGDKSFASQFSSNKNKSTIILSLRERFSMKRLSSSNPSIALNKKRAKTIMVFDEMLDVEDEKCHYFPQPSQMSQSPEIEEEEEEESEEDEDSIIMYDDEFSDSECSPVESRPSVSVKVNWEQIKAESKKKTEECLISSAKSYAQKFRAKIAPGENESAEQELKKQLTKEMFKEMEIIGQFNLGFIVTKLGSDLFIVDQHASDEKFNFEDLQESTVLQTQKLIYPIDLEFTALNENIVIENLDTFQKNGFDFDIDLNAEPTKKVKLSRIPYSKSCEFGKSDVEELVFMMEEENAETNSCCRPSKIRSMLASRACRKSVMIGKPLNGAEMRKIVDHMGDLNQPWNCPHGRPTIRHLLNTNLLPD